MKKENDAVALLIGGDVADGKTGYIAWFNIAQLPKKCGEIHVGKGIRGMGWIRYGK